MHQLIQSAASRNNGSLSDIWRMLPIVPILSAFIMGGLIPASHAAAPKPFYDMSAKALNVGTLDYLRSRGLIQTGESCYTLAQYLEGAKGAMITRFNIKEDQRYYSPDTGEEVSADQLVPGKDYVQVVLKSFIPQNYELNFKQYDYSSVEDYLATAGTTEDSGDTPPAPIEIETVPIDITVLGKTYTFTYSYVKGADNVIVGVDGQWALEQPEDGDIIFDFINNHAFAQGSAIHIGNEIGTKKAHNYGLIKGNFIRNTINGPEGGAIWIWGSNAIVHIDRIEGLFIDNAILNPTPTNRGGSIFLGGSKASIGTIVGAFIGNHIDDSTNDNQADSATGPAIYNSEGASIGAIYADFIGNRSELKQSGGHGGAIYNGKNAKIDGLWGDFIGNYVATSSNTALLWGGAITNQNGGTITTLTGDFIGNYISGNKTGGGGAIYNNRSTYIGTITGNFLQNHAITTHFDSGYKLNDDENRQSMSGGAIYNYRHNDDDEEPEVLKTPVSKIENIFGNFYGNYVESSGNATAQGGAIANFRGAIISSIVGDFIGNYTFSSEGIARGGAIFSDPGSTISTIYGNFYDNSVCSGVKDKLDAANGVFSGYKAFGGAIRNQGSIERIVNSIFVGNKATSYGYSEEYHTARDEYMKAYRAYLENPTEGNRKTLMALRDKYDKRDTYKFARGGAIFNQAGATLTIAADNGTSLFEQNYTYNMIAPTDSLTGGSYKNQAVMQERNEAIFADTASILILESINFGHIIFNDIINGDDYDIHIKGDSSSYVNFNNSVNRAVITLEDTNLILYRDPEADYDAGRTSYLQDDIATFYKFSNTLRQSSLYAKSGTVILSDGKLTEYLIGTLNTEDSEAVFAIDIDFTKKIMVDGAERAMADVLTVFGVKGDLDDPKDQWNQSTRKGEDGIKDRTDKDGNTITVESCSRGSVKLQLSIKGPENWSKDEEYKGNSAKNPIYVQILNFVVMEGIHGSSVDFYDGNKYADYYAENFLEDCPIELELPTYYNQAYSKMYSSDTIAEHMEQASIKTHNDSIKIIGWRDNLAAWAELTDKNDGWISDIDEKDASGSYSSTDDHKKVFILRSATHYLSRDTELGDENEEGTPLNTVWGDDWTIMGESKEGSRLDMQHHNLLTEVDFGKRGALRNFTLHNLGAQGNSQITNNGMLTLDTMALESQLTVLNKGELTLNGIMTVNNTITADSVSESVMFINDQSEVRLNDPDSNAAYGEAEEGQGRRIKTVLNIIGTVKNQNINHQGQTLDADTKDYSTLTNLDTDVIERFRNNSLTMEGGKFQMLDMRTHRLKLRELHVNGGMIYVGSSTVNLYDRVMGGIDADIADYGNSPTAVDLDDLGASAPSSAIEGSIWLDSITLTGDTHHETWVKFVDSGVADTVLADNVHGKNFMGTIMEYTVYYNKNEDQQCKDHPLGSISIIPTGNVNPAVQAGGATQLAGSYVSMMQVYNYAFEHAELYSANINNARQHRLYAEHFSAVSPGKGGKGVASVERDSCPPTTAGLNSGMWLHTYASTETMPLRHGPKVRTNMYGGLIGGDTDLREHRSGWASVYSLYGGYLGSNQHYDSVKIKQNGAAVGATATFYKKNFYTALTASVSVSSASATTLAGRENFDLYMGGIASRSGYNIMLSEGLYVLQPTLLVSYTCFNVHDYTNASGVKMNSKPVNMLQFHPYLKLVRNTECSWVPFVTAGYVYDAYGKTRFKANDYELPDMSIKPYIEYSVGAQRTWNDRYTIYGQVIGRHGGRNGVEANAGLRWTW